MFHFDKIGRIQSYPGGGYNGWYVKLQRHPSGGVYVFIIKNPSDPHSEGYDQFVLREDDLANELRGWIIDWDDRGQTTPA